LIARIHCFNSSLFNHTYAVFQHLDVSSQKAEEWFVIGKHSSALV